MDSAQVSDLVFSHLNQSWCEENIPSLSPLFFNKSKISKQDIGEIKEHFQTFYMQYNSLDDNDKSQETIAKLQEIVYELSRISEEQDFSESETKKSFMVCNSSIFQKDAYKESNWEPSCLVGLNVSFNKCFQIAPDVRTGTNEQDKSALHLIYKWKGMQSNVSPLTIRLVPKEANEFILGAIIMYSIYNPENRNLPVEPTNPKTCKEFLDKVEDWDNIGKNIIQSFDITPENVGSILKKHLTDIVHSSHVEQDMENIKPLKRKKAEEQISDLWSKQKKNFVKHVENSEQFKKIKS